MKQYLGVITEVNYEKSLVKVNYQGTGSDFMPYLQIANSYVKIYIPPKQNEQVLITELDGGFMFAVPSFFNETCKANGDEFTHITEYCDGTIIKYNTKESTLTIKAVKTINISCIDCNVKANSVKVDSPSIDLGLGGAGVVTGECICHFTGAPHGDISGNTRSAK